MQQLLLLKNINQPDIRHSAFRLAVDPAGCIRCFFPYLELQYIFNA